MKNIIIGPAFPLRGGIANFNEALCRAFLKQGTLSEIFSFSLQYPGFLFPGTTQYEKGLPPVDIRITTAINSINPFNWSSVAKKIISSKPDYVIIRYWLPFMAPCLGTIARKISKAGIPVIAVADNIIPHEHRPGDRMFTKWFLNSCDAFVVMAESVKKDLELFAHGKPVVCTPHPIYDIFGDKVSKEEAIKHLELNTSDKHVLFFGFIRKYKGLDLLLEAMGNPGVKKIGIKLIVAGEYYEDNKPYEEQIKRLGIEKNVILKTSFIPREEVKYYFSAADMVVQPYRTATQSGVTQIAYHFDRPMLVTNVGGLSEIVPHNRVGYVTEKEPDSIAKSLIDFYQNNREVSFSSNVREDKRKFTWENFVGKIENIISAKP